MDEVIREMGLTEAFPNLKLKGELQEYLADAKVEKIVLEKENDRLIIFLSSGNWIRKQIIYGLEDEIRRQLFSHTGLSVVVKEEFRLSRQYTPERLWEVYRTSALLECRTRDIMLFYTLQKAVLTFPDEEQIEVSLEDSMIAREKEFAIRDYLQHVFAERCHFPVTVKIVWHEKPDDGKQQNMDHRLEEEARQIFARAGMTDEEEYGMTEDEADPETDAGENEDLPWEKKTKKTEKKAGGRSGDPDQIFGKPFDSAWTELRDISEDSGEVTVRGQVLSMERRDLRNDKALFLFAVTDFTDSIRVKLFVPQKVADVSGLDEFLATGNFLQIRGVVNYDDRDHELVLSRVRGIRKGNDFRVIRMDMAPEKRVELLCHTQMSEMDGVSSAADLIERAYEWGHPAIAITDHAVVQAFPPANDAVKKLEKKAHEKWTKEHPDEPKENFEFPFKVLYGCDAYIVDDRRGVAVHEKGQRLRDSFVVFDLETTGLSSLTCRIIEIGAVRVENGEIKDRFSTFVNPEIPIPFRITQVTSITDSMVENAPTIAEVLPQFLAFCGEDVLVAHNADFDVGFIRQACETQGIPRKFTRVDTVTLAQFLLPQLARYTLDRVAKAVQVPLGHHHRAVDDAACTAEIFVKFIEMLEEQGITTLREMNEQAAMAPRAVARLYDHHGTLLVTNETGRVNLYRMISQAHLTYLHGRAKFPKSLIEKNREGILVGSGNAEGELYQALLSGSSEEEIAQIVSFYDYLEVQPPENDLYMVEDERQELIRGKEDIRDLIRKIVKLGEQFDRPVVATGDVHYMDPDDVLYRRIIKSGKPRKDRDEHDTESLYLRTTGEMLDCFSFLGEEKAYEIVVTNPRKIAAGIDKVSPIREGKFPPDIPDSDKQLREICEGRAHELYGEELPAIVSARLEKELTSIISNGYAVLYIIAQKLIWKCNEDGYLVGSRGSVGSSFAATMAGITEVNPLPPHYLCPKCRYSDFDSETVRRAAEERTAGIDLPDATCPHCGEPMQKLGFQIPFETFLGFDGDKEPDIDLNFSGEYQSKAHKYTEELFGEGYTYRSGTIGLMKDKTAFGFVKKYLEDHHEVKRKSEIERIVQGCVGVRRTSGQHPGGIIVLPHGEDINSFTPVQYPADDPGSGVISTHFGYHSIEENLLKLDLLGHADPTMIQYLENMTGTDVKKIPLDDPKVMTLFRDTEVLGIRPQDIGGCRLGCLGIPEFGTNNTMDMVLDIRPENFSDLIRISGLAHGENVWHGNTQELIKEKTCTIAEAICTRDDIMAYLIGKGLESKEAFLIMESVRKGKGLTPAWEAGMRDHGVPDWYIDSCKKIKYMFPKAHAVAYVTMAYRIAWYKIYYPQEYYAAYFSIRASSFDYETMCFGRDRLAELLAPIRERYDHEETKRQMTTQEKETYRDMRMAEEMYARGITFIPIDLYTADAHRVKIVDGKLMPPLDSIEGLGEKAADAIAEAAAEGVFLSKDDFRRRTRVGKTIIETMDRLSILQDLPESDQISLFDGTGGKL